MYKALLFIALASVIGGFTTGCGQKGDLYLPDQPALKAPQQEKCRTEQCAQSVEMPEEQPQEILE